MHNVLAIGAHPDDIEFGCFGALKKHKDQGDNVTLLVMTQSDVKDAHTKHTRRWIALMCVFSIIVVPIIAPIFTDVSVAYQIVTEAESGWWIFGTTYETSVWKEGNAIFITSLQSHTIFSIIGLYFGGSLTRK